MNVLAIRETSLICNCGYALGFGSEADRTLRSRKIVFEEDRGAIEWIEATQPDEGLGFGEVHLRSDKGGILMRRTMRKLALAEMQEPIAMEANCR